MQTQRVLVDLMRQGKDTLWFFILRNALRPRYLEGRKFDLVVGNPPWLSLHYVRNPQYYQWLHDQILDEYNLLERSRPHLFTQMELATLFFVRAADLYLNDGGTIAFVMPRSVMVAQQHAQFTGMSWAKKSGILTLALRRVLDLEGVTPLFNVPACVLVVEKGPETAYPVNGHVLSGDLLVKNLPLTEARQHLEVRPATYQRVEGRLVAQVLGVT